jgi:hypothetical protein
VKAAVAAAVAVARAVKIAEAAEIGAADRAVDLAPIEVVAGRVALVIGVARARQKWILKS